MQKPQKNTTNCSDILNPSENKCNKYIDRYGRKCIYSNDRCVNLPNINVTKCSDILIPSLKECNGNIDNYGRECVYNDNMKKCDQKTCSEYIIPDGLSDSCKKNYCDNKKGHADINPNKCKYSKDSNCSI